VVSAESDACAAPLTTKLAPGSVWKVAATARSGLKSCAQARRPRKSRRPPASRNDVLARRPSSLRLSVKLLLLDADANELRIAATQSLSEMYRSKPNLKVGQSISGRALKERRPIAVLDVTKDPDYMYPDLARKEGLCSLLSVPMLVKDKPSAMTVASDGQLILAHADGTVTSVKPPGRLGQMFSSPSPTPLATQQGEIARRWVGHIRNGSLQGVLVRLLTRGCSLQVAVKPALGVFAVCVALAVMFAAGWLVLRRGKRSVAGVQRQVRAAAGEPDRCLGPVWRAGVGRHPGPL